MNKINLLAFTIAFANAYQLTNQHEVADGLAEVSSQFYGGCGPVAGGFNRGNLGGWARP